MSLAMIDAIESIKAIEDAALRVFRDYSIVDLCLLIKYKSKNFSCSVKFVLQFIVNTANEIFKKIYKRKLCCYSKHKIAILSSYW